MEKKEMKKVLEKNLEIVTNLWRSLWHRFQKTRNRKTSKNNRTTGFLERSRTSWKNIKRT